jgi:hypothetical protein
MEQAVFRHCRAARSAAAFAESLIAKVDRPNRWIAGRSSAPESIAAGESVTIDARL